MVAALTRSYRPLEVVHTANLPEGAWLEYRRRGIGGSDAAVVMGDSSFRTARDLYLDKRGLAQPDSSNWVAKEVGHRLESLVAKLFSHWTGFQVYPIQIMFAHPLYPFMLADVDFFVALPDGTTAILECKTAGYNSQPFWENDAVPVHYTWQVRHYMAVMNLQKAFVACLFDNNEDSFVYREVGRDLFLESQLIAKEKTFWEEHVQKALPPPFTEHSKLALENLRRYCERNPGQPEIQLPDSLSDQLAAYLEFSAQKAALKGELDALDEKMKQLYIPILEQMGTGCEGVCRKGGTEYRVSYRPRRQKKITKENLSRLKAQHPEIYAQFVTESESWCFKAEQIAGGMQI